MSQSKVEALAGLDKLFKALSKSAAEDKSVVEEQPQVLSHSTHATDPNNKMVRVWCPSKLMAVQLQSYYTSLIVSCTTVFFL